MRDHHDWNNATTHLAVELLLDALVDAAPAIERWAESDSRIKYLSRRLSANGETGVTYSAPARARRLGRRRFKRGIMVVTPVRFYFDSGWGLFGQAFSFETRHRRTIYQISGLASTRTMAGQWPIAGTSPRPACPPER